MVKIIRLTDGDLHRIIERSVNRVISEAKKIDINIDNWFSKYEGIVNDIWDDPSSSGRYMNDVKAIKRILANNGKAELSKRIVSPKDIKKAANEFSGNDKTWEEFWGYILKCVKSGTMATEPKETPNDVAAEKAKPNVKIVRKFHKADREDFEKVAHNDSEIDDAIETITPLIKTAVKLYKEYGAYDATNNFLSDAVYELRRALYGYTGVDVVKRLGEPNDINASNHPDIKEVRSVLDDFRRNQVYNAYLKLNSVPLRKACSALSNACGDITTALSGSLTSSQKNIRRQSYSTFSKRDANNQFAKDMRNLRDNNLEALNNL